MGAGEHRGEHVGRDLGEVEDDRGPELDVGLEDAVGAAGAVATGVACTAADGTEVAAPLTACTV